MSDGLLGRETAPAETVIVRAPGEEASEADPRRCFHPAAERVGAFWEEGLFWSSVAKYCLAGRAATPEDRERIRRAANWEEARALAATLPRAPDADQRAAEVLAQALQLSFETHLKNRAVLLDTGDAPIEAHLGPDAELGVGLDGRGENRLGRTLMAVRSRLRARAEDPDAVQCLHRDEEDLRTVCAHRFRGGAYRRHFTGEQGEYEQLCEACSQALPAAPPRRQVCQDCFVHVLEGTRLSDVGAPGFCVRPTGVHFTHRLVSAPPGVIALAPVARSPHTWLLLDREGRLHRLDVERGAVEAGGRVDPAAVDLTRPVVLAVSPDGEWAAVGEARGRRAVVLEPATGRVTLALTRGEYHVEHCRYPLAFVEREGCLLLLHATDWNRLDVTDPRTGERLTPREVGESTRPVLDYFYSGLSVSPGGGRVLSNGWVWHPYGRVRVFDLQRWLGENPWEAEGGASVRYLSLCAYFWDRPVAWVDEDTVALWGEGEDELDLVPAVSLHDVSTGRRVQTFYGPGAGLASVPPYLVSFDAERGTAVWDWRTGERLAHDGSFVPVAVHPGSRELLSWAEGSLRVSRLVE